MSVLAVDARIPARAPGRAFLHGVRAAALQAGPVDPTPVTDADLAHLPRVVRRYLDFMGVPGQPRDWSFRAHFTGRFRRRPNHSWLGCDAWQYNCGPEVARLFHLRIPHGPMRLTGWDTYLRGRGHMHGKLLGVVPVADGAGAEYDVSELVTYLNDAVLLAPSMLLGPATTWTGIDERSFEVALADAGHRVSARVVVEPHGAPSDFLTTDRYADLPGGLRQLLWSTPVDGWHVVDGRPRPCAGRAMWHLPDGAFTYAELDLAAGDVAYNVLPGD